MDGLPPPRDVDIFRLVVRYALMRKFRQYVATHFDGDMVLAIYYSNTTGIVSGPSNKFPKREMRMLDDVVARFVEDSASNPYDSVGFQSGPMMLTVSLFKNMALNKPKRMKRSRVG